LKTDHLVSGTMPLHSPSTFSDPNYAPATHGPELIRPPSLVTPLMSYTVSQDMNLNLSDLHPKRTAGSVAPCPPALHLIQPQHDCLPPPGQSRTLLPTDAALHSSWINSKPLPPCPAHLSMVAHTNGLLGQFSSMTLSNAVMGSYMDNQNLQPLGTLFQSTNNAPLPILMPGIQSSMLQRAIRHVVQHGITNERDFLVYLV
uniref:HNF_C domain-containing protein n=1 Tax=Echinostoma caproni TaxID=27848 RepID=A0A183AXD8_9TREM